MILRVKTHKICRNESKTWKLLKSHKTRSNSQKILKTLCFHELTKMSRSPNGKLEIQKFLTQGPSLSTNLFSFPIPTRVPDHPPVTSFLSHSHILPNFRVQTSSSRSPPYLTLSLSLTPFPFSLFSFPSKLRNYFPSIRSVLSEIKVRIDSQS
jgi:hypothetical protein